MLDFGRANDTPIRRHRRRTARALARALVPILLTPLAAAAQETAKPAAGWAAQVAASARPLAAKSAAVRAAQPSQPAQSGKQAAAPAAVPAPSEAQTLYLVRATLLALDQANRTGNYTVVRDLAAPVFRERNTAADLAVVFTALRQHGIDLGQAAVAMPRFGKSPAVDAEGALRISGALPAHPRPITFDLGFRPVGGHWRLAEISVGLQPDQHPATLTPAGGQ